MTTQPLPATYQNVNGRPRETTIVTTNQLHSVADLMAYLDNRIQDCDELREQVDSQRSSEIFEYSRGLYEARQAAQQLVLNMREPVGRDDFKAARTVK